MARLPRLKVENGIGWYHLCARVAGHLNWFPFEDRLAREKLLETIRKYLAAYCCDLAAYCLMGNHYHLILRFQPYRILSQEELFQRAARLYPNPHRVLRNQQHWQRFNTRIFDLSEFMRNVQQSYTRWYNQHYHRRGSLWSERFKSVLLGDQQSILDTLLYVELNPVRARLVERPEDFRWSSAALRTRSQNHFLIPLPELGFATPTKLSYADYRTRLYYRGSVSCQPAAGTIPTSILQREEARGFAKPGAYLQRLPFFSDGLSLGPCTQIQAWISKLRRRGYYLRRKQAIRHRVDQATFYTVREQRSLPRHP